MAPHLRAVPSRRDPVRVLVADDHALFAEALMLTLAIEERIEVVGCASSGTEAVALTEAFAAGRNPHGRPHAEDGRHRGDSAEVAAHALAAGAERYLTKDTPTLKLIDAILPPQPAPSVRRVEMQSHAAERFA